MIDINNVKEQFEKNHPERMVIKIGIYKDNLLLMAPYRDSDDEMNSSNLFSVDMETGEELAVVLYQTDFEGINRAFEGRNLLYEEECHSC